MIRKLTLAALVVLVPALAFAAPATPAPSATPAPASSATRLKMQKSKAAVMKKTVRNGHAAKQELRAKRAAPAPK